MKSMRELITLLENPRKNHKATAPMAFDQDELSGKLMNLQSILMGIRHGFQFSTEWTEEVVTKVKQAKLDFEADEARNRARDGDEYTPFEFPIKEAAVEYADKVFNAGAARYSIHSDTRTMERAYQDRKTTDPDNPMDYVEDSDFLQFMRAQDQFSTSAEAIIPSKPSTYLNAITALYDCLDVYKRNQQDEELVWSENLQSLVSRMIPLLRFCLKNL